MFFRKSREKILVQILDQNNLIVSEPSVKKLYFKGALKKIAIAAAAVVALFILNIYEFGFKINESKVVESFQNIESGKSKAILTLDDGKKIDLLEEKNFLLFVNVRKIIRVVLWIMNKSGFD